MVYAPLRDKKLKIKPYQGRNLKAKRPDNETSKSKLEQENQLEKTCAPTKPRQASNTFWARYTGVLQEGLRGAEKNREI